MKEKLKKFKEKAKFQIKEEISWRGRYNSLKYRYPFFRTLNITLRILTIALMASSFCFILLFSKIILFNEFIPYFNTEFSTTYITGTEILYIPCLPRFFCKSTVFVLYHFKVWMSCFFYSNTCFFYVFQSNICKSLDWKSSEHSLCAFYG